MIGCERVEGPEDKGTVMIKRGSLHRELALGVDNSSVLTMELCGFEQVQT